MALGHSCAFRALVASVLILLTLITLLVQHMYVPLMEYTQFQVSAQNLTRKGIITPNAAATNNSVHAKFQVPTQNLTRLGIITPNAAAINNSVHTQFQVSAQNLTRKGIITPNAAAINNSVHTQFKVPTQNRTTIGSHSPNAAAINNSVHTQFQVPSQNLTRIGVITTTAAANNNSVKRPVGDTIYNANQKNFFKYIINNPSVCSNEKDLVYIVYVHSAAKNFKERHVYRSTWMNDKLLNAKHIKRVFMLGRYDGNDSATIQGNITKESQVYGDIIQGDFLDAYRNLSVKAAMAMHWISRYCSNAKVVFKMDGDVVIDIMKYLGILQNFVGKQKTIMCQVFAGNPILRDPKKCMKWCLDPKVLAGKKVYPNHCSGPVFAMTADVPALLYEQVEHSEFVWVDDAYLTGVLSKDAGGIKLVGNKQTWNHMKNSANIFEAWGNYWERLIRGFK